MRVLVVDDHDAVRESLRQLVELRPGFEVVGVGTNGVEAVEQVDALKPDIVLMDMNMPVMDGVEATRLIKQKHPKINVLALTALADMALVTGMIKAGASGYLLKGGPAAELIESLQAVAKGGGALDREVAKGVLDDLAELYKREQERAQELVELDRMKSEFVSVVSHELRTPLTTIKAGVETLRHNWGAFDDAVKLDFLDSMARQCNRLSGLVGQILTVAGIRHGSLGLAETKFRLDAVAEEAVSRCAHKAEGRTVDVRLEDIEATGDEHRMMEVAASLIDNALTFTAGAVTVEVALFDGRPALRVIDEGPGIDDGTLHNLLEEPFTQGDSSDTRRVGGLGLSIYIARRVMEASGGYLSVDTGPDRGSVFAMVFGSSLDR